MSNGRGSDSNRHDRYVCASCGSPPRRIEFDWAEAVEAALEAIRASLEEEGIAAYRLRQAAAFSLARAAAIREGISRGQEAHGSTPGAA